MHKIVKIGLVVISVIGFIALFMMPDGDMPRPEAMNSTGISIMFGLTYLLLAIAVIATVVFGLKNIVSTPGGLKKTLIGVVGLLVLLGVAYGLASGTDVDIEKMAAAGIETSESGVKKVGAGINMFFIMLVVAVVLIAWGAVKKALGK